jgi:putative transposase
VCIPPKVAVAEWVRHVKGFATREVNNVFPHVTNYFGWQTSYGVLTFGVKNQEFVIGYIARQKEHHANNRLEPYLERMDEKDE